MSEQQGSSSPQKPSPAFFPIPILTPLLRSYDVPAPVIVPPRSDPCSSSNPNLHRHQVLETLPSMDADPWAVASRSRSEIVTKSFDLTESEQAGVTFSKPATMVCTKGDSKNTNIMAFDVTCDSEKVFNSNPKNIEELTASSTINLKTPSPVSDDTLDQESENKNRGLFVRDIPELVCDHSTIADVQAGGTSKEPIAQQTVNEMAVPTIENQNMKSWFCDICNVTLRWEMFLKKHKEGRKHQNNLKKLSVPSASKPKTSSTIANDTLCQKSEKAKQDLLLFSRIPKPVIDCPNAVSEQLEPAMKNLEKSGKMPDMPSAATASVLESPPSVITDKPKAKEDKVVILKESESLQCELCGVCCTSSIDFHTHISGRRHLKNVVKTQKSPSPARAAERLMQDLVKGGGKNVYSETSKRKGDADAKSLASDENGDRKRQKMMVKEDAGFDVVLTCKVCNVACEGAMAYGAHVATREHAAMALKSSQKV